MAAEFCIHCRSLIVDGKCTGHKGICPVGCKRRRVVDFKKQGYARNKRTGALIDKETGVATRVGREVLR